MLTRSAFAPRHKNSRKAHEGRRFPSHLAWIRKRPCLLAGNPWHECEGRMEAAHVDHAGGKGMSLKVADFWAVPLCSKAHRRLHDKGFVTFEGEYGVDLIAAARDYASHSPHRQQWERQDA